MAHKIYPATDLASGAPAAASHVILTASAILAAVLWNQPRYSFAASLFAFSAATFATSQLKLPLEQLSVGWASLAILHILVTLALNRPRTRAFTGPIVLSGYLIAALAVLPPLFLYNQDLRIYPWATGWRSPPGGHLWPGVTSPASSHPVGCLPCITG